MVLWIKFLDEVTNQNWKTFEAAINIFKKTIGKRFNLFQGKLYVRYVNWI